MLSIVSSKILATDYYVAQDGSGSFTTIQAAANVAQPGDTIYIKQGTYYEQLTPANSGTPGNYITYRNYGTDEVIISNPNAVEAYCIQVNGKDYLQFVGLNLILTGSPPAESLCATFRAFDGSDYLILDGLTCENGRFGVLLFGNITPVTNVTLKNSTIINNGSHGIFLYKKVYDSIIGPNNQSCYNGWGEGWGHGIVLVTEYPGIQADGSKGITIIENEINNNATQGIQTWNAVDVLLRNNYFHHNGASGIQLENGSENIVVENNISEYNAQIYEYETGAWVDGTINAVLQNNICRNNKMGLLVCDSIQVIVRNNVVYENNRGVPSTLVSCGIAVDGGGDHNLDPTALGTCEDIIVVHNTLYKNGSAESQRAGMNVSPYSLQPLTPKRVVVKNNIISETAATNDLWVNNDPADYTSDYNDYYNIRNLLIYWRGNNIDWSSYVSVSGDDSNSIIQNPSFINAPTGNFHLQSNSPCIDRGTFLTRTTSSGNGITIQVEDARYFTDGFGVIDGDEIVVGLNSPVKITNVNYANNTITVDASITWSNNDPISYPYAGLSPDIGVYEYDSAQPTPTITVTSPNGGETWFAGDQQAVTWTCQGTVGNAVGIDISSDGGTNWATMVSSTANDGTQVITVPNSPSLACRIRVADVSGTPSDISDSNFTISPGVLIPNISLSVTTLNFGEVERGQSKTLTFDITNTGGGTLSGYITTDRSWIIVNPSSFASNNLTVSVTVDNAILGMSSGQYVGIIPITSNGGNQEIDVIFTATPGYDRPVIQVSSTTLNFGEVEVGKTKTLDLIITNKGIGTLSGTISTDKQWIQISPTSFLENDVTINVTVNNEVLGEILGEHTGRLTIDSNGGADYVIGVIFTATCVLSRPNPYDPSKGNLTFFGDGIVPGETTIKIYTLSGELVKELNNVAVPFMAQRLINQTATRENEITWNGTNENGEEITSGIYIYVFESPKEQGVGKFTVIRN